MLEKELKYYSENQDVLIHEFNNKFIVIKDEKVLGVYKSENEAYFETIKSNKMGEFLVQYCSTIKNRFDTMYSQIIVKSMVRE